MSYMMRCPHCRKALKADLEMIGRKVACNGCRKSFVHPDADELIARVKFADDPASKSARDARKAAEAAATAEAAVETAGVHRSALMLGISLVSVVAVGTLLFVFRNRGDADAAVGPAGEGTVVAGLRDTGDLPSVETLLDENRPYALHLSSDAASAGIRIDSTGGTATVQRNVYQLTGAFLDGAELRRLLDESQTAGHKPTAVTARDADGSPMVFVSNVYVAKPTTAAWLREVRDRARITPPFAIAAAVDSGGNIYLETIRARAAAPTQQAEVRRD